jgi:hypothetical protein
LPSGQRREAGSAVVEFVLVTVVAVGVVLAVAQLGLLLWERNALMGSLSEGARVAAAEGGTVGEGRRVAVELWRVSVGGRVARAVAVEGAEAGGVVVLRAEGTLPSFVPGVPGSQLLADRCAEVGNRAYPCHGRGRDVCAEWA